MDDDAFLYLGIIYERLIFILGLRVVTLMKNQLRNSQIQVWN